MKRLVLIALAAVLLAAGMLGGLAWRAWTTGPSAAGDPHARYVVVEPGTTLRRIAADLQQRGILEQPRLFLLMARLGGCDRQIQVGRYELPPGAPPRELLRVLCRGRPMPVMVTLPEGLEAAALAAILADSLQLAAAAILEAADALIAGGADTLMHPAEHQRLALAIEEQGRPDGRSLHWCEGYIAPDTYHFAPLTDATTAARMVIELQLSRLAEARRSAGRMAEGYSTHALLTLASLVETEVRRADERARVAGVYHRRLQRGMRLEADPTVAFWLGKRGERLLFRDLEVASPYNTYRTAGLPAGPIGNPGLAAMLAAARPDTVCGAMFFVADGAGGHIFSETLAEHRQAVARYRRLMLDRRR